MGVKVILCTGINDKEKVVAKALEVGILKEQHRKVCGSVVDGKTLEAICRGYDTGLQFDITPEYLSVIWGASNEQRAMLIEYLCKLHPGRVGAYTPSRMQGFGSETLKTSAPVATVGAVGSGENDVPMMQKASISFSTS